jgi:AcrR family transcriptional regulator
VANPSSALARRREQTCDAILDATGQLIAEKGADGFTISEVAQRSTVNRALIYHYFKDRDNLVFEAIRHIASRYEPVHPEMGPEAAEHAVRMHIEHPEIGRFFYQMLLSGRPLPSLSRRVFDAIEDLERFRREHAPDSPFDPAFAVVAATLVQLAWGFARDEIARHLGVSVEEADRRFIAQLARTSRANLEALANNAH